MTRTTMDVEFYFFAAEKSEGELKFIKNQSEFFFHFSSFFQWFFIGKNIQFQWQMLAHFNIVFSSPIPIPHSTLSILV